MLSTAAFFVTGAAVLAFARSGRRPREMQVNANILRRDMGYFIVVYALVVLSSFLPNHGLKVGFAVLLLLFYAFYVYRTVTRGGATVEMPERLYLERAVRYPTEKASLLLSVVQFFGALAVMIGGARLFVSALGHRGDPSGRSGPRPRAHPLAAGDGAAGEVQQRPLGATAQGHAGDGQHQRRDGFPELHPRLGRAYLHAVGADAAGAGLGGDRAACRRRWSSCR